MRISLAALWCAVGFAVSGGSGTRADDKADLAKEVRKFQGTWTFESSKTGGKKLAADAVQECPGFADFRQRSQAPQEGKQ
jgi:hypothetical protein